MPDIQFDVCARLNQLGDALKRVRDEGAPELEEAARFWASNATSAARRNLPSNWRLGAAIENVVKRYSGGFIFAMAGVPTTEGAPRGRVEPGFAKGLSRSVTSKPGFYARYHETGYKANGRYKTRPRFYLRKAKRAAEPEGRSAVEEACQKIAERMRSAVAEETAKGGSR